MDPDRIPMLLCRPRDPDGIACFPLPRQGCLQSLGEIFNGVTRWRRRT
jgi:hypothetical protein